MLKNICLMMGLLGFYFSFSVSTVSAQQSFDSFWTKFKTAVIKNDKKTIVSLTRFPLKDESENDEGPNPSYSKSKFLREYSYFFNQKIKRCLKKPDISLNGNNRNEKIFTCQTARYIGLSYMFEKTKKGWKWINFNRD